MTENVIIVVSIAILSLLNGYRTNWTKIRNLLDDNATMFVLILNAFCLGPGLMLVLVGRYLMAAGLLTPTICFFAGRYLLPRRRMPWDVPVNDNARS